MSFFETVIAVVIGTWIYHYAPALLRAIAPSLEQLIGWAVGLFFFCLVLGVPTVLTVIGLDEGGQWWRSVCLLIGVLIWFGIGTVILDAVKGWFAKRSAKNKPADPNDDKINPAA